MYDIIVFAFLFKRNAKTVTTAIKIRANMKNDWKLVFTIMEGKIVRVSIPTAVPKTAETTIAIIKFLSAS